MHLLEISSGKINPIDVEVDLSIVALVGSNMKSQVGISGQMFGIARENGINIKTIAQGSSERNIIAFIQKVFKKAINVLHEFFVNEIKQVKLFIIGLGNVGKAFLINRPSKVYLFKGLIWSLKLSIIAN